MMPVFAHGHRFMIVAAGVLLLLACRGDRDGHRDTVRQERTGVVNVNTADVSTLTLLPGIRTSTAQRIADYRSENGRFKVPVELILVRGVGELCFEQIRPYTVTDGATTLTERVRLPRGPERSNACR